MRRAFRLRFGRGHISRAVDDEMSFHLEMRTHKLMQQGMSERAARQEALRQFGNIESVRDSCVTLDQERERAMKRANVLDEVRQDATYALRTLRRNIGFALVIVLTLAIGIGSNTAIFTLINAVVLRKLPVPNPEQLVAVGDPARVQSLSGSTSARADLLSYAMYKQVRDNNRVFSGILASGHVGRLDLTTGTASPEHPRGRFVSGNYFSVLKVPAYLGRTFDGSEDAAIGTSEVVVISHGYWTRRFNSDPHVLGSTVKLNGVPMTIVGVTPDWFTGEIVGLTTDIFIPLTMQQALQPYLTLLDDRGRFWLLSLGRLAPGVTLERAKTELDPLIRRAGIQYGPVGSTMTEAQSKEMEVHISSGAKGFSRVRATYTVPLVTLMIGVALLLLIICGNVANLLLARGVTRVREMSVRAAIGAGRFRIVRQLLTESLVLALLSAAAGLAVAWGGTKILLKLAADGGNVLPLNTQLDAPVLLFTLLSSVACVTLFGLVPALRAARVDLASTMRAHAQSVRGGTLGSRGQAFPMGKILVAGNIALSLVLLIGAGLLVRSLQSVQNADPGLDRDHLLIVDIDATGHGYKDERLQQLTRDLSARFSRIPEIRALTFSENGIFSGTESNYTVKIPGFIARTPDDSSAYTDVVGPGYAKGIGARIVQGRDFTEQDDERAPNVAVINESMAKFYFPKGNAVGNSILMNSDSITMQIIGVMADVKDHDLKGNPVRRFYMAYRQHILGSPGSMRFEIRTFGDPRVVVARVRNEVRAADSNLTIDDIDPLTDLMRQSIREERLVTRLGSGFGVLALLLAAVGLYGVMTYAMTRRTGEIGLRVALGAQKRDVMGLVLSDAMRLVVAGLVIGVPLALMSTRLLRNQLHGVSNADPTAITAGLIVMLVTAALAALIPALRALRVAPVVALKQE